MYFALFVDPQRSLTGNIWPGSREMTVEVLGVKLIRYS